jgi:hypothetical protein
MNKQNEEKVLSYEAEAKKLKSDMEQLEQSRENEKQQMVSKRNVKMS